MTPPILPNGGSIEDAYRPTSIATKSGWLSVRLLVSLFALLLVAGLGLWLGATYFAQDQMLDRRPMPNRYPIQPERLAQPSAEP